MKMRRREHAPLLASALVPALLVAAVAAAPVSAQTSPGRSTQGNKAQEHRIAVVTANDVYVRSGGGDSYYPYGKMKKGDLVEVIGEKYGWAHVVTRGPAFEGLFGYVRTMPTQTVRFTVDASGKKGRTEGPVDLLAANLNSNYKPSDSWKRILAMPGGVELTVLETIETDEMTVHKVRLPANAKGWISARYLQPATAAQVAVWTEAIASRKRGSQDKPKVGETDPGDRGAPIGTTDAGTPETGAERPGVLARNEETLPPAPVRPILTPPAEARTATGDETAAPPGARPGEIEMGPDPVDTTATGGTGDSTTDPGALEEGTGDAPTGTGVDTAAPTLPEFPPPLTNEEAEARYHALEEAHARLRKEPILTAEVLPLSELYLQLADESVENDVVAAYAAARADQLVLWSELQARRSKIAELRKRLELSAEEAEAVRLAVESEGIYEAVGRLAGSTIFDGGRLALLYRVHDARTGRTIGYLRPNQGFDLAAMVGQIIGVVGDRKRDASLRITILEPRRIDLLVE